MRYGGLLVALVLVVGLAGAVVALHSREENSQFVSQQRAVASVGATLLERLILTTRDPRPEYAATRARARVARCTPATSGALGNPWRCVVRYSRLPRVRYRVVVHADGSIAGSGQPEGRALLGVLTISGCCVAGVGS
jgi:hypothetical protein